MSETNAPEFATDMRYRMGFMLRAARELGILASQIQICPDWLRAGSEKEFPNALERSNDELLFSTSCVAAAKGSCEGATRETLITAVRDEIGAKLIKRRCLDEPAGRWRKEDCEAFAELFVDKIWIGSWLGRPPRKSIMTYAMAAYRFSIEDEFTSGRSDERKSARRAERKMAAVIENAGPRSRRRQPSC